MIRSWSPALCRRRRLVMAVICGPAVPALLRACSWSLWICLALLLLVADFVAEASDSQPAAKPSEPAKPAGGSAPAS